MPVFNHSSEDYEAIRILLTPAEQELLDQAVTYEGGEYNPAKNWEASIHKFCQRYSLGSGLRAKFRIAVWFWCGQIRLRFEDPRYLDPENRRRFVRAITKWLDLPMQDELTAELQRILSAPPMSGGLLPGGESGSQSTGPRPPEREASAPPGDGSPVGTGTDAPPLMRCVDCGKDPFGWEHSSQNPYRHPFKPGRAVETRP